MIVAITLNPDLDRRVQEKLATGLYRSVDDVLSAALRALDDEEQTIAAINEGYEDFKAGRYESWEKSDAEFRKKHGIQKAE
ncbi:MAG: type II toxin-antitoxin system ParD family antitoxin [Planctomycetes bacterium]|nr:type II toxin-antitoxin system ParD family antitoxin [Planctomycetota bacterium]